MMGLFRRHRREAEEANRRAAAAAKADDQAAAQLAAVKRQAAQSRSVTAALRNEVDKNGWTELLLAAMQKRGAH